VLRHAPFTIVLNGEEKAEGVDKLRLKIDPGSKVTGLVLVREGENRVIWAAELRHRGEWIRDRLAARRSLRQNRRSRKTRHRAPRFSNRRRPKGQLRPSIASRVHNVLTWVERLRALAPVAAISFELAKFDTRKMQDPEVSGIEYAQGELFGYEVREYLLEKWGRRCAYCGLAGVPLEVEHIVPRSRGGSNRVSNLTLACKPCNQSKGGRTALEFGHPEVQARAKRTLRDAAAMNSTRWAIHRGLQETGLPIEVGTAARTKRNRISQTLPKAHWIDAACVGGTGANVRLQTTAKPLRITARGHGVRRRCRSDRHGFPIGHARREKRFMGYATGDLVRVEAPGGKFRAPRISRVAIRHRPSFRVHGVDVHPRYLRRLQRSDGYDYA
jgi:5-methylcytosine-specific restriction endonuclease McrA